MNGSPDFPLHRLTRRAWLLVCLTTLCRGDGAPARKAPAAAGPGFVYRAEKRGRVTITTAWRTGSEKDALRLLRPQGYAANESWRSIVAARKGAWVTKLDALDARKPVTIIVGLDHLIGPEGMVAQIAARGYKLTAVKS